ncbi:MAG: metallophosphoesterase [Desulfobacterales bacterium]|nr:MAG: metallophosphoesterase [Desulfobacterales bacterium]
MNTAQGAREKQKIMKVGILSDIHVDIDHRTPDGVLEGLAVAIKENRVDMMIIAGDIANDYELTLQVLHSLEDSTGVSCLFVPGNHDIWNEQHPAKTSWDTYNALQKFQGNLSNGPHELASGWIVIGDIGWYDYSFGSRQYTIGDFDRMIINGRVWQDKLNTNWGKSTIEMHQHFYRKLEQQVQHHQDKKIVLVTHVLPLADFTVRPANRMWQYLNAFLGSRQYGRLALKYSVAYSICGHVHYRMQRRYENTVFICNCLNYASQWRNNDDPIIEVGRAFKTITFS